MAIDFDRFLRQTPIKAKPPTIAQRAAKWSRRNVAFVWSTAAVCILIAIVLAISTAIVLNERTRTAEALSKVKRIARLAQDAIDNMYVEFADQWIQYQPGLTQQQKGFLEQAARYYEQLLLDVDDDSASIGSVTMLRRLAMTYRALGELTLAISTAQRAVDLGETILRDNPDNAQAQAALAETLLTLDQCAYVDMFIRDDPRRRTLCKRSADLWETVATTTPDDLRARASLAKACIAVAKAHRDSREYADSDIWADRAYQTMSLLVASHADNVDLRRDYGDVLFGYHQTRLDAREGAITTPGPRPGQREISQTMHVQAIDNARWLVKQSPHAVEYQAMLARALMNTNFDFESQQAIDFLTEAIGIWKRLHEQFPDVYQYEDGLRLGYHQIREPLLRLRKREEAISAIREDIAIQERRLRLGKCKYPINDALNIYTEDYQRLDRLLAGLGRHEERQEALLKGRDLLKAGLQLLNGRNDASSDLRWRRGYYEFLAKASWQLGEKATASDYARQLITEHRRVIAVVPERERAFALQQLAWLLVSWPDPIIRDPEDAIKLEEKVLTMEAADDANKMCGAMVIGLAHLRKNNWSACIEWMERPNERSTRDNWPNARAVEWFALAIANGQLGHKTEARKWYQRAVSWIEDDPNDMDYSVGERPFDFENLRAEAEDVLGISRPADTARSSAIEAQK